MFSVYLAEDFSDNEEMFAKDITKWSSNDLMDKIETIEVDEAQGRLRFCQKLIYAHPWNRVWALLSKKWALIWLH